MAAVVGTVVAIVCATVGVFTVMRGQSFASRGARRHRHDRRIGGVPGRRRAAVGHRRNRRRGGRGDGADRHPASARAGPGDRDRARRRARPGGAAVLPRRDLPQHHRRSRHDPVRLGVRDRARNRPGARAAERGRARDRDDAVPAAAAQLGQRRPGGRTRDLGTARRSRLPAGARARGGAGGDDDRHDPLHRAAGRTGGHGAAPDQAARPGDRRRRPDRRRHDVAGRAARLRQLRLAAAGDGLARELLRGDADLHRISARRRDRRAGASGPERRARCSRDS